jgi:hypothetical protein
MKEVRRSQLPWKDCTFNPGVQLVGELRSVEAIIVGDRVICIIPPWPQMPIREKYNLANSFNGELVFIEVKVSYTLTGKYYNPKDLKKNE